jgi:hypothetical protein
VSIAICILVLCFRIDLSEREQQIRTVERQPNRRVRLDPFHHPLLDRLALNLVNARDEEVEDATGRQLSFAGKGETKGQKEEEGRQRTGRSSSNCFSSQSHIDVPSAAFAYCRACSLKSIAAAEKNVGLLEQVQGIRKGRGGVGDL